MRTLKHCGRIEVRESPIEGFGVFANSDISAGEIIEEVPFVLFPRYVNLSRSLFEMLKNSGWVSPKEMHMENLRENFKFKEPERYYFKWHPPVQLDGDSMFTVLPLGFAPCYNTSNTENNADWKMYRDTFVFTAEKDIKKDSEIKTFYGYYLGGDGTIFPCENMFPSDNGLVHKFKIMRFGTVDSYNAQKHNPIAFKLQSMLDFSVDGLTIKRITLAQANGDSVVTFEVPTNLPLTPLYQKLTEYRSHPAPLTAFKFEYTDKKTQKNVIEDVVWKK